MAQRFDRFFRLLLVLLALGLFWAVWNGAAKAQDPAPPADTNLTVAVAVPTEMGTNIVAKGVVPMVPIQLLPQVDRSYLTFGLTRIEFLRENHFLGIALWQYIASFLFIFFAFYVSKLLDLFTRVWLKRVTQRTPSRTDDLLLQLTNGPVKIIAFVLLLHVGLSVFDWPPLISRWLSNILKVIVAVSVTYALLKIIDIAIETWRQRHAAVTDSTFDKQLTPIIRKSLQALIVAVAALVTLDNIGVNITTLVASLSIGGLALGLAAQDTIANLFGAVAILIDKPFKVGDRIQLDTVDGTVEAIGLRSTRIRNLDGFLVTVPNKTMGNATVTNVSARPNIRTLMNLGVTYNTPPDQIKRATEILGEVLRGHPGTKDAWIGFNRYESFSLNLFVVHWWNSTDFKAYLAGMQEMNLEIKRRFDAEGISFAFPTQTVYHKQDDDFRFSLLSPNPSPSPPPGLPPGAGGLSVN
jgi:MscS family membrane protein